MLYKVTKILSILALTFAWTTMAGAVEPLDSESCLSVDRQEFQTYMRDLDGITDGPKRLETLKVVRDILFCAGKMSGEDKRYYTDVLDEAHQVDYTRDVEEASIESSLLEDIRSTWPQNCVLEQGEYVETMQKGVDWMGLSVSRLVPSPGSDLYKQITGYVCAGIPVEEIQIEESNIAVNSVDSLIECANMAAYEYASSQRTCDYTCEIKNRFGDKEWTSGKHCVNPPDGSTLVDDSTKASFLVVKDRSVGLGGCYLSAQACQEAQRPYIASGLINNIGDQCALKAQPYLGDRHCFMYSARREVAIEDRALVGTGTNNCFEVGPQEDPLELTRARCEGDMAIKYGRDYPESEMVCTLYEQSVATSAKWCMNDSGWTGKTQAQVETARGQEEERIRKNELNRVRIETLNAISYGGEGGLVPECDRTGYDGAKEGCGWYDLVQLVNTVISFAIRLAAVVMVIIVLFAGWGLITARGNPEALQDARSNITKAVIGFIVVLLAWSMVSWVMGLLLDPSIYEGQERLQILQDIQS